MKQRICNSLNLKVYTALAGSFLALSRETAAQAVYVDIDPDTVLTGVPFPEDLVIELNSHWAFDFLFGIGAGTFYADWCECYPYEQIISLGGTESKVVYTSYQFTSNQYLVSALNFGVLINQDLNFKDNDTKMAYKVIPDWSFYYAFEGGAWLPETIDKFVGIRFTDTLDCLHYGWIRCSVEDGGSKLTIKDYAYESKCDVGIAAGDKIGDTSVAITEAITFPAIVYSFEHDIYVSLNVSIGYSICIYNTHGQMLINTTLSENTSKFSFSDKTPGVYLVKLIKEDEVFTQKVVIN